MDNPSSQSSPSSQTVAFNGPMPEVTVTGTRPDPVLNTPPDPTMQSPGQLDPSLLTTPDFQTDSSVTDSSGSAVGSVLSGLTGGTGLGGLLSLGADAAIAGYGLSQAKGAQQQTQNEANQILGPSNALLGAGQSQLSQFQSQTLTPLQKSYVDFATQEGQDIIQSGGMLKQISQQYLGDFSKGQLNPADQMAIDQNVAAQKQQIAQSLANNGTMDSSVLNAYNQQIDNQALVTKKQILDSYFTTGNNAYNSWLTSTQQGSALIANGAQFAQTAFQDMMTNALGLTGQGMSGLTTAIGLIINSDTAIQGQVSQLMSNLASAAAYQLSGGGPSGAKQGSTSSLSSMINMGKTANSAYNNLSNLWASYTASTIGPAATAAANSAADTIIADTAPSLLGDVGDAALGFNTAGGGAAAGAGSGVAGGAGAAAGGGSAAALTPSILGDSWFAPALSGVGTGAVDAASATAAAEASSAIAGAEGAGAAGAAGGAAGGGAGGAAAGSVVGGIAAGVGALGAMYGLWEFDQMQGKFTPEMQYKLLENTTQMAQQQTQQLQQDISSGKAVPNGRGGYNISGVDSSVYYPLAGMSAQQVADANADMIKNFLTDQGTDWTPDVGGVTGVGPGKGGNRSNSKV